MRRQNKSKWYNKMKEPMIGTGLYNTKRDNTTPGVPAAKINNPVTYHRHGFSKKKCLKPPLMKRSSVSGVNHLVLECLHFAHSSYCNQEADHKLFNIWPILNYIISKVQSTYILEVLLTRTFYCGGRSFFWKILIQSKHAKFAVKSFCI